MARTNKPDEVYPLPRLHRWFALAGLLLAATSVWLVWADWARPWKSIQRDFVAIERSRLGSEHAAAQARLAGEQRVAALQQAHEEARQALVVERQAIEAQRALISDLRAARDVARQAFEGARAALADLRYSAEILGLEAAAETAAAALAAYRQAKRRTDELERALRQAEARLASAEKGLEASLASEREARRRVDEALSELSQLESRLVTLAPALLRDAPLVDFLAPSLKVRQIVIPDLRDDIGFATIQKEDRCTTCHLGIDREPYQRHPETGRFLVPATREAVERQLWQVARAAIAQHLLGQAGAGALNDFADFEKQPSLFFADWLDRSIDNPAARAAILEATRDPRDAVKVHGATFGAHPDLQRYAGAASPHPLASYGCSVCHQGLGHSTDFVRAAHTPDDPTNKERWRRIYGWERSTYWEHPQLPLRHVTASCATCHDAEVKIDGATAYNRGRRQIEQLGCFGCHRIESLSGELLPVGPGLTKLASKYGFARTYQWIWEPRSVRPQSRMPRFFAQSNNSRQESLRATQQEARSMAAFLVARSVPFDVEPLPPGGDARRGRILFETAGCLGCHSVRAASQAVSDHSPDLSGIGSLLDPAWIYAWTRDPQRYLDSTRMPSLRLEHQEALDVTRYLATLVKEDDDQPVPPRDERLQAALLEEALRATMPREALATELATMSREEREELLGEVSMAKYGCYACHEIAGFAGREGIGPELTTFGSKPLAWLDFAHVPATQIPRTRIAWATHKLRQPRVYDLGKERTKTFGELLRMPSFGLADEPIDTVVTFLLSRRKRSMASERRQVPDAAGVAVQQGRKLARQLNCYGCHHFDGEGGDVARYWVFDRELGAARFATQEPIQGFSYADHVPDPVRSFVPPALYEEGRRVRPEWLFGYLREPAMVRPGLATRMPTFALGDEEANVLVRMLTGLEGSVVAYHSSYEPSPELARIGEQMFVRGQCTRCHLLADRELSSEAVPRGIIAPNLKRVPERLQADWIPRWLADPQKILPGTKMASFFDYELGSTILDPNDALLEGDLDRGTRALRDYLMLQGRSAR